MKTRRKTFTVREINEQLNNAVAYVSNSTVTITSSPQRKGQLAAYSAELTKILYEDVENGDLLPEELAQIFVSAGLLVWAMYVSHSGGIKLPQVQDLLKEALDYEEKLKNDK